MYNRGTVALIKRSRSLDDDNSFQSGSVVGGREVNCFSTLRGEADDDSELHAVMSENRSLDNEAGVKSFDCQRVSYLPGFKLLKRLVYQEQPTRDNIFKYLALLS